MNSVSATAKPRLDLRIESVITQMSLAKVLEANFGSPLFSIETLYCSNQHQPVVVTHMYLRGDRYACPASIRLGGHDHPPQGSLEVPKRAAAGTENSYADDHQ